MTEPALFELDDDLSAWRPIFNAPATTCRDCGRTKFTWERGCGGATPCQGIFNVCDDCAALEGVGERHDGLLDVSRWGIQTSADERARLVELQSKRRGAWLRATRESA